MQLKYNNESYVPMITIFIWSNKMNDVRNKILLFSKIYIILLLKRSSYALDILYHCKYIFLS